MIDKINSVNNIADNNKTEDNKTIPFDKFLNMLDNNQVDKSSIKTDNNKLTFKDTNNNVFNVLLTEENKEQLNKLIKNDKPLVIKDNLDLSKVKTSTNTKNNISFVDEKPKSTKDDGWKFNFNFGFNRTKYFNTDMHLSSSRINATIKDFEFKERTSADFYNPKTWKQPMDALRWIDEPTNSFTISAEKNNNIIFATAFHPKFLKQDHQNKHVTGTVDCVQVDKVMPINEQFDGYNNQPGEMNMTRFENTHMQMDWQLGYGRRINIANSDKYGSLSYIPSIHAGLTTGQHLDVYVKEGEYWQFDEYKDKNRIQGANLSLGNRVQYDYKKFSAFVENKMTVSHLEHPFLDGTAKYNMKYNATTFGVGVKLFETKGK